jgi:hypothetical protein
MTRTVGYFWYGRLPQLFPSLLGVLQLLAWTWVCGKPTLLEQCGTGAMNGCHGLADSVGRTFGTAKRSCA